MKNENNDGETFLTAFSIALFVMLLFTVMFEDAFFYLFEQFSILVVLLFLLILLKMTMSLFDNGKGLACKELAASLIVFSLLILAGLYLHAQDLYQQKIAADEKAKVEQAAREKAAAEAAIAEQQFLDSLPPCEYKVTGKPIFSLERQSEISGSMSGHNSGSIGGSFILGFGGVYGSQRGDMSGSIGQVIKYYFYSQTEDGGYILDSVPGDTPIYERDDIAPQLIYVKDPIQNIDRQQICNGINTTSYAGFNASLQGTHGRWMQIITDGVGNKTTICKDGYFARGGPEVCDAPTITHFTKLVVPTGTIKREFKPN